MPSRRVHQDAMAKTSLSAQALDGIEAESKQAERSAFCRDFECFTVVAHVLRFLCLHEVWRVVLLETQRTTDQEA